MSYQKLNYKGSRAHKAYDKYKGKIEKVKLTEEQILADRKRTEDEYNKLPKKLGEPKKPEGSGRSNTLKKSLKILFKKYGF